MIKISVMFPVTYNKSDPGHTHLFFRGMSDNGNQIRAFGIRLVTIYQRLVKISTELIFDPGLHRL
jgi:hypothetical protein